jgi:hypothetical protein
MNTYLTIDLDFWNFRKLRECKHVLERAKEVAKARRIEIKFVDEHHNILPDLNASGCERTVNLDYHSDICNNACNPDDDAEDLFGCDENGIVILNCGTWANHVNHKLKHEFVWINPRPRKIARSYCHFPQTNKYNPFLKPELAGWEKATKLEVTKDLLQDLFYGVKGISVAISYEYLNFKHRLNLLKQFAEVFGIEALPKPDDSYYKEYYMSVRKSLTR